MALSSSARRSAALLAMLGVVACGGIVKVDGEAGSAVGGGGAGAGAGGPGPGSSSSTCSGPSGGTGGLDQNALETGAGNGLNLVAASYAVSCPSTETPCACGTWEVTIRVSPEATTTGFHPIDGVLVDGSYSANGPDEGGGDCWAGGGTLDGLLELQTIGESKILFQISQASVDAIYDAQVNNAFLAQRCF